MERIRARSGVVRIALVGKYVQLQDAYLSVVEALRHAAIHHGRDLEVMWVDAEGLRPEEITSRLEMADGILVPGGFGIRGIEGKIMAIELGPREQGAVLGHLSGYAGGRGRVRAPRGGYGRANSSEFDPETPYPVIDLLPEQKDVEDMGGTMRLGASPVKIILGTKAYAAYGDEVVYERHRHRYEVNNSLRAGLEDAGLVISGVTPDERLVEIIELRDHPWFVACSVPPGVQEPSYQAAAAVP